MEGPSLTELAGQDSGAGAGTLTGDQSQGTTSAGDSRNKATRPDWLGEDLWDEAGGVKLDDLGKRYSELAEFRRAAEERDAGIPKTAEEYKLEIPDDIKGPSGEKMNVDMKRPLFVEARELMAKHRIPPDAAQELYLSYVKDEAAQRAALVNATREEFRKLGSEGVARVAAIGSFLAAHVGEDAAKPLMEMLRTADQVRAFEAMMKNFAGGNVVPFNQRGQSGDTGAMSDDDWNKLSPSARLEYARRVPGGK